MPTEGLTARPGADIDTATASDGAGDPPATRIGYTVHAPPEATGTGPEEPRKRRVFYLRDYDRPLAPDDVYAKMHPGRSGRSDDSRGRRLR